MIKVLVIDDNITDLNGICTFTPWEKLDCEVVGTARDGEDGLTKALQLLPELIITDISMPKMDGMKMCQEIRKAMPDVSFIFLSCLEAFEYVKEAIKLGNCDYITKPIVIEEVIKSILKVKKALDEEINKQLTLYNLEKQIKKNLPYLMRSFLRDILFGVSLNRNAIRQQAHEFSIDVSQKYTLILFELSGANTEPALSTQYLSNLISNNLINQFDGWSIDYKYNSFAVILKKIDDGDQLLSVISDIQGQIKLIKNTELTVCIGNENIDFFSLHNEFENISCILDDNFFYITNGIIFASEFQQADSLPSQISFSQLNKEISVVLTCEGNEALDAMISKYLTITNEVQLKAVACYLIVNLNIFLYKMNLPLNDDNQPFNLENIMTCKTMAELIDLVKTIFLSAHARLNSTSSTSSGHIVNGVMDIIEKNYQTIETIEDITDNLHFNLMYANRVFKHETGMTIYEYLLQFRMEKAKQLLSSSTLRAYEIGERVGYKTAKYFSVVFKKHTGMTPKQYRLSSGGSILGKEEQ